MSVFQQVLSPIPGVQLQATLPPRTETTSFFLSPGVIPYKATNPITYWVNRPNGCCQVKDLPEKEREIYIQEFNEKEVQKKKYLREFSLKSCKRAVQMLDLTEKEIELWICFLKYDGSDEVLEYTDDLFEDTEGFQGANEEVQVTTWEWNHDGVSEVLIDINAWPGDNQSGAIFYNEQIVMTNSDDNLSGLNTTPGSLKERLRSFQHIRSRTCMNDEDEFNLDPVHEHCKEQEKKYNDLLGF